MKKSELWTAGVLIFFSLVCLVWVIPNYTSPPQSELGVRPSFIPNVAVGTMLFLSILMLYQNFKRRKSNQKPVVDDEEFGDEASGLGIEELANISLWVISSAIVVFLMGILGYIIVSSLFMICLMIYAGQRSPVILILVSIVTPVLIWQITWYAFSIQLPMLYFNNN
jgi:ABC-type multidrug transport system fused ATPase/permease subunit